MAFTLTYAKVGKAIYVDGAEFFDFYGQDFNPNTPSFPHGWTSFVTTPTNSFNLSGFQPGHEVGVFVFNLTSDADFNYADIYAEGNFQQQSTTTWYYDWSVHEEDGGAGYQYAGYMYFGVDYDEIWSNTNNYQIVLNREVTSDGVHYGNNGETIPFTISSLSIDDDLHPSGYMWVEGENLCYVDGIWGSSGYKHKIAYNSNVSTYVGSDKSGHIRLDSSDNLTIHYVSETGRARQTYPSSLRYGGNVNVGTTKKGYMRVSDGGLGDGYGHLCFIAPNGSKRRILNGPPGGY